MESRGENPHFIKNARLKYCFVPGCSNSALNNPEKIFVSVPKGGNRVKWLTQVRREPGSLSVQSTMYCCEDHFDLREDLDNYMRVKLDASANIQLKKGVLPRFFNCQPDRKRAHAAPARPVVQKLRRIQILKELEEEQATIDHQQYSRVADETQCTSSSLVSRDSSIFDEQEVDSRLFEQISLGNSFAEDSCEPSLSSAPPTKDIEVYLVNKTSDFDQIDGNEKCRCCLKNTGDLKSFSDSYSSDKCVSELFTFTTSLEVSGARNNLPTKICHGCLCELNQSYKFVLKCRESDNKLRTCLDVDTKDINIANCLSAKTQNAFTQTTETIIFANDVKIEIDELDPLSDVSLEHHKFGCNSNQSKSSNDGILNTRKYESTNIINQTGNNLNECDILKHEIKIENEYTNNRHDAPPVYKVQNVGLTQFDQLQDAIRLDYQLKKDATVGRDTGYHCKLCPKSFKIYALLKSHQKIHSKTKTVGVDASEKPYSCVMCEKAFEKNLTLIYHMRTHTGDKPHSCKLCDKSYSQLSCLNTHMRTHTREKPHS